MSLARKSLRPPPTPPPLTPILFAFVAVPFFVPPHGAPGPPRRHRPRRPFLISFGRTSRAAAVRRPRSWLRRQVRISVNDVNRQELFPAGNLNYAAAGFPSSLLPRRNATQLNATQRSATHRCRAPQRRQRCSGRLPENLCGWDGRRRAPRTGRSFFLAPSSRCGHSIVVAFLSLM